MAVAKIEPLPEFDWGRDLKPWKERRAEGKMLRRKVPRESHADWKPAEHRPNPRNCWQKATRAGSSI